MDGRDVVVLTGVGVLGKWVADVLREASSKSQDVELACGDRYHGIGDVGRTTGGPRIVMIESADWAANQVIASGSFPVLAVLDDPVDTVRYLRDTGPRSFMQALREQTCNASANHALLENPAVLLLRRGTAGSARSILSAILDHLGLMLQPADREDLFERFGGPASEEWSLEQALERTVEHHVPLKTVKNYVSEEEAEIVRQALMPMVLGALTYDIGPITWVAKVLLREANEPPPPVMDMTGPPRLLLYGPYLNLPPGEWSVQLILGFSEEARGAQFRLIATAGDHTLANVCFRADEGGALKGLFSMRHSNPENYFELQFLIEEGMIEGRMAVNRLIFTRTGAV